MAHGLHFISPIDRQFDKGGPAMGLILLILLILLLMGGLPTWGYSRGWGYGPSGLLGLLVVDIIPLLHPVYITR
jgi:hypothetical protein